MAMGKLQLNEHRNLLLSHQFIWLLIIESFISIINLIIMKTNYLYKLIGLETHIYFISFYLWKIVSYIERSIIFNFSYTILYV